MRKISLISLAISWLILTLSCAHQESIVIKEPTTPRVVIKKVPAGEEVKEGKEEYYESNFYPDLTRGYIENQAFPYVPEVWLLIEEGQKVLLIGSEEGPLEIARGAEIGCNLPPGENILHVCRWQYLPYHGGWQKIKHVEIVTVSVAEFSPGKWQSWSKGHYGWKVVIGQHSSAVYSGYVP